MSSSRTGRAKQATYSFARPKKSLAIKIHPSPTYTLANVPVYQNPVTEAYHFIQPDLYESGVLPDRFLRAAKLIDIYVVGGADGSFSLWAIKVGTHSARKGALKAVDVARNRYVIVEWFKAASTYNIEPMTEPIPEPNWAGLPTLEAMMLDAFESVISVADDKVVLDYMSGGVANRLDKETEE